MLCDVLLKVTHSSDTSTSYDCRENVLGALRARGGTVVAVAATA